MRLSEAIRLGSMLGPQAFHQYETDDGATCALGAASVAVGNGAAYLGFFLEHEKLLGGKATCPACRVDSLVVSVIVHLNDEHRWTREAIADWVETVEAGQKERTAQSATTA